jgi:putative Ca2+/H+ antiporter (TMEM165/GDT1 family)
MDFKILLIVFATVFFAELGDKTQIATMLFAADKETSKFVVFLGSSSALILASGLAVLGGAFLSEYINTKYMSILAGIGFIIIGCLTLYKGCFSA